MSEINLQKLVWQTADTISATGKSPTVSLIAQSLNQPPASVAPFLATWRKKARQLQAKKVKDEMTEAFAFISELTQPLGQQNNQKTGENSIKAGEIPEKTNLPPVITPENDEIELEPQEVNNFLSEEDLLAEDLAEIAARAEKKAQYMAAAEIVLTQQMYRHYRKTKQFSDPEIDKQVKNAITMTQAEWEEEMANFSLTAILKRYGK